MDESGHDHKTMPYEVRGGVALHVRKLWPFVRAIQTLEESAFGVPLHRYKSELKGHQLLDRDRFRWAAQDLSLDELARRKYATAFLERGKQKQAPTRQEFTAYGQASLMMARGIFELLVSHEATLLAVAIPRTVARPPTHEAEEYLRKDQVFLLERYFHYAESKQEMALLVMDETDKEQDRAFVRQLQRYFTRTDKGRYRSGTIVPTPFFVSSDMTYPIQAADVCIYCLNWAYRIPSLGMDAPVRKEIIEFVPWLRRLKWELEVNEGNRQYRMHSVEFVPDPYSRRIAP